MKIGIQGGRASYHEAAVQNLHPENIEIVYYKTFFDLFQALKNKQVDRIVSAIANNRVQYIPDPYLYLTTPESGYKIVGETYIKVNHMLLGAPGARLSDIREIHSQAPAIGQCQHFLETHLPDVELVEADDTAGSAELISKLGDKSKAAIASELAGQIYGLDVLAPSIQDDPENITRFFEIILTENDVEIRRSDKTTMLLWTPQTVGALAGALDMFRDDNINIASLQSKIIPNTPFDMVFFVEFEAGIEQENVKKLLSELTEKGYKTEILGSYTKFDLSGKF